MKYLKTYHSVNESNSGDLSFDEFKDIMIEMIDEYEYDLKHETVDGSIVTDDNLEFYDCWIFLKPLENPKEMTDYQYKFLVDMGDSDDPNSIEDINKFKSHINNLFNERLVILEDNIKYLTSIVEYNKRLEYILNYFKEYILPRFQTFSNFLKCTIGAESYISDNIEYGNIRITFDIKK